MVIKVLKKAQPSNPATVKAFAGYSQGTNIKTLNYVSSQKVQSAKSCALTLRALVCLQREFPQDSSFSIWIV